MGRRSRSFTVQVGITSYVVAGEYEPEDRTTGLGETVHVESVTHEGVEIDADDYDVIGPQLEDAWLRAYGEDECEARWEAQNGGAL